METRLVLVQLLPFVALLTPIYYLVYTYRHFLKTTTGTMRHGASKSHLGIYGRHSSWPCFVSYTSSTPAQPAGAHAELHLLFVDYVSILHVYIISVYHQQQYTSFLAPFSTPLIRRHPSPRTIPRAAYPFFLFSLRPLASFFF